VGRYLRSEITSPVYACEQPWQFHWHNFFLNELFGVTAVVPSMAIAKLRSVEIVYISGWNTPAGPSLNANIITNISAFVTVTINIYAISNSHI